MPDFSGRLRASGRVAILVSRYNELITTKLLEGALACCREAGMAPGPDRCGLGARRLRAACGGRAPPRTGSYACLVALGAVIRGDTPHFEYVAGEAARGLSEVAVRYASPGRIRCADGRYSGAGSGPSRGERRQQGHEAAAAALQTADVLAQLRAHHAED